MALTMKQWSQLTTNDDNAGDDNDDSMMPTVTNTMVMVMPILLKPMTIIYNTHGLNANMNINQNDID